MAKQQKATHIKKAAMLKALESTLGVVSPAAKKAKIDRATHYKWMGSDEGYRLAVHAIEDMAIDFVESKLHQRIKEGNVPSTIFFMKTKGKKRGYIEKTENETTIKGGGINIDIVLPPGDIE